MKRALTSIALASALWAFAGAYADFRNSSVPGVPYDVDIRDAGWAAVASGDGGFELLDPDGGTLSFNRSISTNAGPMVSAFIDSSDCLTGVTQAGEEVSSCRSAFTTGLTFSRVRHSQSGSSYATGSSSTVPDLSFAPLPPSGSSTLWTRLPESTLYNVSLVTSAVSAFRLGAVEYGLFGFLNKVHLSADAGASYWDPSTQNVSTVTELQLFSRSGNLEGLVGGTGGVDLLTMNAGAPQLAPLLPFQNVSGMSFATGTGDGTYGDGFGMLVVQNGGVSGLLYRAVPNPNAPARQWVASTANPAGLAGPLSRASCLGAEFCVLLANASGSGGANLSVYRNRVAPTVDVSASPLVQVNEGAFVDTVVNASDADGDAVFLTWDAAPVGTPVTVATLPTSAEGKAIRVSATAGSPLLCNQSYLDFPLTVHVSDGLAGHENTAAYNVRVVHTQASQTPSAAPQLAHLPAGGAATLFSATPPGTGCQPQSYNWSLQSGAGFTWSASGNVLTVTPSQTFCQATPGTATFAVRGVEAGGLLSSPATLTFFIDPWGAPHIPLTDGAVVSQAGGTTVTYAADTGHTCNQTVSFPGVDTSWQLDGGTLAGAGISVAGQLVNSASGPQVAISVPDCVSGTLGLTATNTTHGDDAGIASSATETISVQPVFSPLSSAQLTLEASFHAGQLTTQVTAPSANCPALRHLRADLQLHASGGGLLGQTTSPVPGDWSLAVDDGCGGNNYQVSAQLSDDTGVGPVTQASLSTQEIPVGVGALSPATVSISCGQPAQGQVSVHAGEGKCQAAAYRVEQVSGPSADIQPIDNQQFHLQTQSSDFNALLGETLGLSIAANGGVGNTSSALREVQIVTPAFVQIAHTANPPLTSDSSIVDIRVELFNPTACAVDGVTYRETLSGLRYVPGSLRMDPPPTLVHQEGDVLSVENLTLAPQGRLQLTYQARPRLLSKPSAGGQAFAKGVPISDPMGFTGVRSTSCACGHSDGPPVLGVLGLVALAFRARRRARGRR